MDGKAKEKVLSRLRDALKALSLPGEMQLDVLPCFTCCAAYLVTQYESACSEIRLNWGKEFTPYIDASHQELLDILASQFSYIPGKVSHGWLAELDDSDKNRLLADGKASNPPKSWMTDESVKNGAEWQNIRRTAVMVLSEFGWTPGPPSWKYAPSSITLESPLEENCSYVDAYQGDSLQADYYYWGDDYPYSSYSSEDELGTTHCLTIQEAEKKRLIAVLNESLARSQRNLSLDTFLLELIWLSCPSWFQLHKCLYDNTIPFEMWW